MVPWFVLLILLIGVFRITNLGAIVAIPVLLIVCAANFFLFDRAVVHERTGFRCRRCGYDLQGQCEARCPECGALFDLAELSAYKASKEPAPPPASRFRTLMIAVIVGLITILLLLGVLYTKSARRRPPQPTGAVAGFVFARP
jgi:hypothetical protein